MTENKFFVKIDLLEGGLFVEKVKPDPLNLMVKTSVGIKILKFCLPREAFFMEFNIVQGNFLVEKIKSDPLNLLVNTSVGSEKKFFVLTIVVGTFFIRRKKNGRYKK